MTQIWQGLFLYCILVTGILHLKSGAWIPVAISTPAILYLFYLIKEFEKKYAWMLLPFDQKRHNGNDEADVTLPSQNYKEPAIQYEKEKVADNGKDGYEDTSPALEDHPST